jgi:hypothetical protein
MPHPPEFADTDPRAMEVWLSLQRRMAPGDKLTAVLDASALVLSMYEAGVRLQHPDASDREVLLRTAARHLSRDLMIRAYAWDPEGHEDPS